VRCESGPMRGRCGRIRAVRACARVPGVRAAVLLRVSESSDAGLGPGRWGVAGAAAKVKT